MASGTHRHHESSLRNRLVILETLSKIIPSAESQGDFLEIGSGTGALVEVLAPAFPRLRVQSSEYCVDLLPGEDAFAKSGRIRGTGEESAVASPSDAKDSKHPALSALDEVGARRFPNVLAARHVDLLRLAETRPTDASFDYIHLTNVLHCAPKEATLALLDAAGSTSLLKPKGKLTLYGPFQRGGGFTTPSNAEFDAYLKRCNPVFGVRDMDEMEAFALGKGLKLEALWDMPANNFFAVFSKM